MRYISFGTRQTKVSEVVLGTMRIAQKTPEQVAELIQTALAALQTDHIATPKKGPATPASPFW